MRGASKFSGRVSVGFSYLFFRFSNRSSCQIQKCWGAISFCKRATLRIEQCQMVAFVADDLGFWGPGIPDLVTEFCPLQGTAYPEDPKPTN